MKPKRPNTFEHSVHLTIGALGLPNVAELLGKTESLIYQWGNRDRDVSPAINYCLAMDIEYMRRVGNDAPFLSAYSAQLGRAVEAKAHRPGNPLKRVCDAVKETAEACEAFRDFASNRPTECNAAEALREIHEAVEALQQMERDIETILPDNVTSIAGK